MSSRRSSGRWWLGCTVLVWPSSTLWASSPIAARHDEFKNQAPINSKEPVMETRNHREAWNKGMLVGQNPVARVKALKEENQRQRFLSPDEIGRIFAVMEADPNQTAIAALTLLLLTGMRLEEASQARWEHVDLAGGQWWLPKTKNGRGHYITLSEEAKACSRRSPASAPRPGFFRGVTATSRSTARGRRSAACSLQPEWSTCAPVAPMAGEGSCWPCAVAGPRRARPLGRVGGRCHVAVGARSRCLLDLPELDVRPWPGTPSAQSSYA